MAETTIYLIRHGEVDNPGNVIYGSMVDVRLSKEGFDQIEFLAKSLFKKSVIPDVIFTSNLLRAVQTAEKIREVYKKVKIIKKIELRDVSAPGLERYTLAWERVIGGDLYNYKGPEVKGVQIERPEQQVERFIKVLSEIRQDYFGKTIFVVIHADPIAFAMWKLLHPHSKIPSIVDLRKKGYQLKKAQAWRVVFGKDGEIIEEKQI